MDKVHKTSRDHLALFIYLFIYFYLFRLFFLFNSEIGAKKFKGMINLAYEKTLKLGGSSFYFPERVSEKELKKN